MLSKIRFVYCWGLMLTIYFPDRLLSQQTIYSQNYAQRIYLNPALTGSSTIDNTKAGKITSNTRTQWIKLGNRLINQSLSFESPVSQNAFTGISFTMSDFLSGTNSNRKYSHFNGNIYYAYSIPLSYSTSLRSGLNIGYSNTTFGSNQFNWEDQINTRNTAFSLPTEETALSLTRNYFNVSAGMALVGEKYYITLAAHHLNSPSIAFFDESQKILPSFNGTVGFEFYEDPIGTKILFELLGQIKDTENLFRGMFHYKRNNIRSGAGLNIGRINNMGSLTSLSVYFGFRRNQLYLAYSNDVNLSLKNVSVPMTHEISFVIFPYLLKHDNRSNPFPEY